jgi:hypothetical protein
MKISVRVGQAAAAIALALPVAASAQYTGTSHPDETAIESTASVPQQSGYQALPAPVQVQGPTLKPNPQIPLEAAPANVEPTYAARMPEAMMAEARVTAKPDPDAGIVTRIPGPSNQLPVGTLVKVRLGEEISTVRTASGTLFTAQLVAPVERDGRVLLPAGSTLAGMVTEVHGGKRISGAASIHLRTTSVTLPDGTRYHLTSQVIDTSLFREVKVDREGTILRRDHAGKTTAAMALPVGGGIAAGALVAGVPGAVVGGAVGAGVSTVVWLKQDRQTELPVNTKITFALTQPLTVGLQ